MLPVEVTVLMAVYNGEAFVKEAIESVLSQTFRDFEFLIINDGSTDKSDNIIKSFKDERIVYLRNEKNEGLIASLNRGLSLSRGKYIARMDADDICMPGRLKKQLDLFYSDPDIVVAGSDYIEFDKGREHVIRNENDSDYQKATLLFATCFAHPTVMFKNIFAEKNSSYNKNYVHTEDYKLWTDLSFFGKFGNAGDLLLKYRRHSGQITSKHRQVQYQKSSEIRREYCGKLGFNLNQRQFETLDQLGNNVFVKDKVLLNEMLLLLQFLLDENKRLNVFGEQSFMKCINRFWYDICGHTNLGMYAYNLYFSSETAAKVKISFKEKIKLLGKCLIRKFRS